MKKILSFLTLLCAVFSFAANYYWVGGSGNWTDINHWRTTSGGSSLPSVIPGPTDNVFFDSNSGFSASSKTVTLDNTGNCHNITFSGSTIAPTLTQSGAQILNIYGSSEWQAGMADIQISGIYYRHTGEAKTIKSNGVKFSFYVYFEEENSISLLDDLYIKNRLELVAGTWNTNNFTLTFESDFRTSGTKPKTINLGSSQIYLTALTSSFDTSYGSGTVNPGTSHIHFTNSGTNYTGLKSIGNQTYYNVSFEGTAGALVGPGIFNRVEFKGNGNINGSNTFKELILAPTKTYIFQAASTQTITSLLSAKTPQCGGWSTITSSAAGTQASIVAATGVTIDVSGVIMKDVKSSGGATFTAINSVDNGNNTGWTFPAYSGQDLYWVGGSGNWNDKTHWAQTSGGIGGYCVPGPKDNTFFDVNSGFTTSNNTVTIDNISYTHNITFAGSTAPPSVAQNGVQTLNVYGSSEWQAGMSNITLSNIYYRNTGEAKTIKSNGVKFSTYLYFEEENSISLLDDFSAKFKLELIAGTWNTNNFTVSLETDFKTSGAKPKTINLGSSQIYLTTSTSTFDTSITGVTVNGGTSHIHFTASGANYTGLKSTGNQTYYDISFEGPIGALTGPGKFNCVEFIGNGTINGSNTFKELILAPTKTYIFQAASTQTITSLLSAKTPQCGGWSTITSSAAGTQASIVAATGVTIDVSGVIMKDVKSSGGATFTAMNSVDNGNNTGWTFPAYSGQDLYWVDGSGNWNDKTHWSQSSGGLGGYCVPGPRDNTFFDVNSGFTTTNKTLTFDNISYTHNITFAGSSVPPSIAQSGPQILNIYGSSEWQAGMTSFLLGNLYYRHTGEAKTIKSNGVKLSTYIYIEEENSISLLDDFYSKFKLELIAGTWNTNNYTVTIETDFKTSGTKPKIINLGSSKIYLTTSTSTFDTNIAGVTVNGGTSHIHFTASGANYTGLKSTGNQTYYNISFEGPVGALTGPGIFNRVEFIGNGTINGSSTFKELVFSAGKTYILQTPNTQTIETLTLGGTPCAVTFLQSNQPGTRSNINITGNQTNFNFANLKDINASGKTLHFGEQSTIANQNNNNITYDPYNPGAFSGFGADWIDHTINNADPSTYILSTDGFYGNQYTTYKWYKINDSRYNPNVIISTDKNIDIRSFGMGTYRVEVNYNNTCIVKEDFLITPLKTLKVYINPNLRMRVK